MTRSGRAPWAQWRLTGQESLFYCTYSLTASHCSAKAHLAGVPFPRSFDSPLVLRQSCSARLKRLVWCGCKKIHQFRILIKAFLVKKKGTKTVLSRVAKLISVAPCASDVRVENFSQRSTVTPTIQSVFYARLMPSGSLYIESWYVRLNENAHVGCNA